MSISKGIKKVLVGDGMGVRSIILVLVDYYNNDIYSEQEESTGESEQVFDRFVFGLQCRRQDGRECVGSYSRSVSARHWLD